MLTLLFHDFYNELHKKVAVSTTVEMALHHIVNPILQIFISISRLKSFSLKMLNLSYI